MKKILPIILALIGTAIGGATGVFLQSTDKEHQASQDVQCQPISHAEAPNRTSAPDSNEATNKEYVKLNNQFVVPIVKDEIVTSLVLISLSVEVDPGSKDTVYEREPKLRDAFLQVMFDHANMGGFQGAFTNSTNLNILRNALQETAQGTFGPLISDVLILEIARQEV